MTTGDGAGQVRTAEPPSEFDLYELVLLIRPDSRPELDHDEAERLHSQHLGHLAAMRESGKLKVAGPSPISRTTAGGASACTRWALWPRRAGSPSSTRLSVPVP